MNLRELNTEICKKLRAKRMDVKGEGLKVDTTDINSYVLHIQLRNVSPMAHPDKKREAIAEAMVVLNELGIDESLRRHVFGPYYDGQRFPSICCRIKMRQLDSLMDSLMLQKFPASA